MKKIVCFISLLIFANNAFALRCGNELISVGDIKYKVLSACGQPVSEEVIGYIDREDAAGNRVRVMKIEEWIIQVTNYGKTNYYSLVFEGNKLFKINAVDQN
ncbi:DUF2845 domain-containing protein [Microbulbifer sp. MLAF003]|uniref:DUF2845 domain-containing protein n=1 Tax=Microbulbifer TaxID=48073 RepID=UPI0003761290|nr:MULTISPECIES: DUF2845 domain-containing protein [Microbulbifer]WHI49861.1 DUF2845 domain-containing protein [Microbulbifer sp. MLAF003]